MLCSLCKKKEADFEVIEIVSNKRKSIYCCENCRDKYQSKEFNSYFNNQKNKEEGVAVKIKCPNCNQTLDELFKNCELGCEVCFNQFKEYIDQMAIDFSHVGKAPIKKIVQLNDRLTLTDIESKLKSAIQREDFIAAQELKEIRDRLLNK